MTHNNSDIVQRIKYLMRELNCRQVEFARRIGIDNSNLSKYLNGHLPMSDAFINRIVVNVGVSKQWLVDGTDLPFAKSAAPVTTDVTEVHGDLVPAPRGQGTPVYNIDVTAGNAPRERLFADEFITGWVNLPKVIDRDCRIVRVSGDSMSPVIQNGDFIAVRELTNTRMIFWGHIYVVLLDDFRLVKYLRRHPDPARVILRSENPAYDDMEVLRTDIRELMFVQHILHLDTRL